MCHKKWIWIIKVIRINVAAQTSVSDCWNADRSMRWCITVCEVFEEWLCPVSMDQDSADGNAAHLGLLASARLLGAFRWNLGEIRGLLALYAKTRARLISWLVSHTAVMRVPRCCCCCPAGGTLSPEIYSYLSDGKCRGRKKNNNIFLCI